MGHDDLRFSVGFMMFVVFAATFVPAWRAPQARSHCCIQDRSERCDSVDSACGSSATRT